MKKVIIIHAWGSNPKEHWYQEEKKILENLGYKVFLPEMPGGDWPKKDEWLEIIKDLKPDNETVLIGHSLGTPAILRYLEIADRPVDKFFSIAGFAQDLKIEQTKNFVSEPFAWDRIRRNTNHIYVINEINDPYVPLEIGREIAEKTGGEFIEVPGNIHFDKMDLNLINTRIENL